MTLSGRFPYVIVAVLGAIAGLGALVVLALSIQDAWSTGRVYLPRLSRYRSAEVVEWQKSVLYLGALLLWSVGGALALPAFRLGPRLGYAAVSSFLLGALLFIFSWWHVSLIAALVAATLAFVCFIRRVGPTWLHLILTVLAFGGVVYVATL